VKLAAPFSVAASLRYAGEALSRPPSHPHIERPAPRGDIVARFALPLKLCKPFNRVGRAGTASAKRELGGMKTAARDLMAIQVGLRLPKAPLEGRPHVLCCRFSSVETDVDSGWSKNPVDRLRVGHNGLGFIVDDRPKFALVNCWWEYAPPSAGFVYVELRRGA
jgi:hypothetical protein